MNAASKKKSLLIIHLGEVGDLVVSGPIATTIKNKHPDWHICWLTRSEHACLFQNHPGVDELIQWDDTEWQSLIRSKKYLSALLHLDSLKSRLRKTKYEIAINLQSSFKTSIITWLSSAKHRISLGSSSGSHWLMTKTISRELGDQSQIGAEYRYLVSQLGYNDSPWKMYAFSAAPTPESEAGKLLESQNYIAICPFGREKQYQWPSAYWSQLCLRIRGRYHLKTVILGSSADAEKASHIARNCGGLNLAGQTSILETSEIIKRAKVVIGIDTGLTHIAHAHDTATLALFGASRPYNFAGIESSKVIQTEKPCSPCHDKPSCKGSYDCMNDLSPDSALSAIKQLLRTTEKTNGIKK